VPRGVDGLCSLGFHVGLAAALATISNSSSECVLENFTGWDSFMANGDLKEYLCMVQDCSLD